MRSARAVPTAKISYHYRTILDGMAVNLRYRDLPRLLKVGAVHKVYPSVRYHLDTNKSPSVIRADTFWATTGGRGQGVKIGVVDDGVDSANPFFNPAGFSYPTGFPKGGKKWTTPKVIVARAFPGPAPADRAASRSTAPTRSTARTSPGSRRAWPARSPPPAPTTRR